MACNRIPASGVWVAIGRSETEGDRRAIARPSTRAAQVDVVVARPSRRVFVRASPTRAPRRRRARVSPAPPHPRHVRPTPFLSLADVASFRKARKPHVRYVAYALAGAAACVLMAVASAGGAADVAASALGVAPAQGATRPRPPPR